MVESPGGDCQAGRIEKSAVIPGDSPGAGRSRGVDVADPTAAGGRSMLKVVVPVTSPIRLLNWSKD